LSTEQNREAILIVDDDKDIRTSLAEVLMDEGYQVEQASDGEEALECLRSGAAVSLIILDVMMPRMDGYQFRSEQLKDPRLAGIPVVLVTAGSDAKREAAALGVADGVRKPTSIADLLSAIERIVS
jgi:CheY-like chemotaxis protein